MPPSDTHPAESQLPYGDTAPLSSTPPSDHEVTAVAPELHVPVIEPAEVADGEMPNVPPGARVEQVTKGRVPGEVPALGALLVSHSVGPDRAISYLEEGDGEEGDLTVEVAPVRETAAMVTEDHDNEHDQASHAARTAGGSDDSHGHDGGTGGGDRGGGDHDGDNDGEGGDEDDRSGDTDGEEIRVIDTAEPNLYPKALALAAATDRLSAAHRDGDPHARDAVAFVRTAIRPTLEAGPDARPRLLDSVQTVATLRSMNASLGEYAVRTGDSTLAQITFDNASPEDKWLMYAVAYEDALNADQLANWRVSLENTAAPDSPEAAARFAAAQELALCQIELQAYRAPLFDNENPERQLAHRNNALEHANSLHEILEQARIVEHGTFNPFHGSPYQASYAHTANRAFAAAGIVEGIREQYSRARNELNQRAGELSTKAMAGELSVKDRYSLVVNGSDASEVLLWINAMRNGHDVEPPDLGGRERINFTGLALLERGAPDLMARLPIEATNAVAGLQVTLEAGQFEGAETTYQELIAQRFGIAQDSVAAALLMSRYRHDISPTSGAHAVYADRFWQDLAPVAHTIGERGSETLPELNQLYAQLDQLQDPVSALVARTYLLHLYNEVAPEEPNAHALADQIALRWSAFERREGADRETRDVRDMMGRVGVQFVRDYKTFSGSVGFAGYRPFVPGTVSREDSRLRTPGHEMGGVLGHIEKTQRVVDGLNGLLEEERYRIVAGPQIDRTPFAYNVEYIVPGREPELIRGEVLRCFHHALNILTAGRPLDNAQARELAARLRRIVEGNE